MKSYDPVQLGREARFAIECSQARRQTAARLREDRLRARVRKSGVVLLLVVVVAVLVA